MRGGGGGGILSTFFFFTFSSVKMYARARLLN